MKKEGESRVGIKNKELELGRLAETHNFYKKNKKEKRVGEVKEVL